MAQAKVVTVSAIAKELGVCTERVRQLISEVAEMSADPIGLLVGRTIVLTPQEAARVKAAHGKKRKYDKSA